MRHSLPCPTALSATLGLVAVASARQCQNLTVELPIESRNAVFNLTAPDNNIEATNFALALARQGHNATAEYLTGYATIKGTYEIAATYCEPDDGPSGTVQLLTHGINFDRSYWDLAINDHNYSYVARATDDYGYSTFAWDRLGIAQSQHGDAVNEIQSSLEIAALLELTARLRGGAIPGVGHPGGFGKVVHVGHSFGSIQSYSLAVLHPEATDGLVLTGFTQQGAYLPYFAIGAGLVPARTMGARLADYPAGYLALGSASAVQANLLSPEGFDPAVLELAYSGAQPVTVGEMLTLGSQSGLVNPLTGPVLIITGGRDLAFCGGDCHITGNASLPNFLEISRDYFPHASKFDAVVVGESGHGLNLEYSHPYTYSTILDFVTDNVGR